MSKETHQTERSRSLHSIRRKGINDKERKSSGFASLTAFHDLQAKDKQAGIEAVIEHQAEKKLEEQESGKDKS